MDWPLFIRVTSRKDGGEIDRKVPVGLVRGCEVCWVADGCDTRRRPQHRSGGPACPAVGAVSQLSVPSMLLLEEDCLQMWKAILTERFMFSPPYPILLLLQLQAHSLDANNWQKNYPHTGQRASCKWTKAQCPEQTPALVHAREVTESQYSCGYQLSKFLFS